MHGQSLLPQTGHRFRYSEVDRWESARSVNTLVSCESCHAARIHYRIFFPQICMVYFISAVGTKKDSCRAEVVSTQYQPLAGRVQVTNSDRNGINNAWCSDAIVNRAESPGWASFKHPTIMYPPPQHDQCLHRRHISRTSCPNKKVYALGTVIHVINIGVRMQKWKAERFKNVCSDGS